MISVSKTLKHWNYYLALENDLEKLSRYIEFDKDNFQTFSIELAHLLLASSAEVDVVMKELCTLLLPEAKAGKIIQYQKVIQEKLPELIDETIFINRYGISVKPWINWKTNDTSPNWWKSYNKVKHERDKYFNRANLQHTINALGSLLIVNYYYYKVLFEREKGSIIEPRLITSKLQDKFPFVELDDVYYYDNLVC